MVSLFLRLIIRPQNNCHVQKYIGPSASVKYSVMQHALACKSTVATLYNTLHTPPIFNIQTISTLRSIVHATRYLSIRACPRAKYQKGLLPNPRYNTITTYLISCLDLSTFHCKAYTHSTLQMIITRKTNVFPQRLAGLSPRLDTAPASPLSNQNR